MTANSFEYLLLIYTLLGIGHASYHNLLGWVTLLSLFHTGDMTCPRSYVGEQGSGPDPFAQLSVFLITFHKGGKWAN